MCRYAEIQKKFILFVAVEQLVGIFINLINTCMNMFLMLCENILMVYSPFPDFFFDLRYLYCLFHATFVNFVTAQSVNNM